VPDAADQDSARERHERHRAALDAVEQVEVPLLAWGDVEWSLSEPELITLLRAQGLALTDDDALDLIDEIEMRGLLFQFDRDGVRRYRSRASETVRLLSRLRQLFRADGWAQQPRLVRDFRFAIRPRRIPRRDVNAGETLSSLRPLVTERQQSVVARLVGSRQLGRFQLRAAQQILEDLRGSRSRGVVVTAGTGGGKTLAYYLPALTHITPLVDKTRWVKSVSVYPRNELLRDQLSAVFQMVSDIDEGVTDRRPIQVGALFQETPYSSRKIGWRKSGGDYVCPLISCPACLQREKHGDLIWSSKDAQAGKERLTCSSCGFGIDGSRFALTRESMRANPPDLVFASAEMLHRSTSDLRYGPIVGLHVARRPVMLLLDEIHTYEGIGGAQTAQVIRRWRHLVGSAVEIVGLSATLPGPVTFLSQLTGLPEQSITPIEVTEEEVDYRGAEYLLALRHDPAAPAQALSTSIQALMVLARTLDPMNTPVSDGLFGSRTFAFTDRLDVVNRLHSDFLDAEGRWQDNRPKVLGGTQKVALATLRNPIDNANDPEREADGQVWMLPLRLGHDLRSSPGLTVGRVSSQDPGMDQAPVIIATASLEVGFDDDRVGAVLQHGAPRDMAQFLQRRGRAGRPVGMRPWTVVVLSDNGRDRRSYQSWDTLFDPELPAKSLPVANRSVRRIHAAHGLIDWIALEIGRGRKRPNLRAVLGEEGANGPYRQEWEETINEVLALVDDLLASPERQSSLLKHITEALEVPEAEAVALLWHPPRALLTSVAPTLARRLRTLWTSRSPSARGRRAHMVAWTPLPDFVSRSLFEALESPDVSVAFPIQRPKAAERFDDNAMALEQALREFAPGNASRRFSFKTDRPHWVAVPTPDEGGEDVVVEVGTFVTEYDPVGTIRVGTAGIPLLRPSAIKLSYSGEGLQPRLADRPRAQPIWISEASPTTTGTPVALGRSPVADMLGEVRFHLHADAQAVQVRRGLIGSQAEQPRNGTTVRFRVSLSENGSPVAIGTSQHTDGFTFTVAAPADLGAIVRSAPAVERAARTAWFEHCLSTHPQVSTHLSSFAVSWVNEGIVSELALAALNEETGLEQAASKRNLRDLLVAALEASDLGTASEDQDAEPLRSSYLRTSVIELLEDRDTLTAIENILPALWSPLDADAEPWLKDRYRTTVGEAALSAATLLCPDQDPDVVVLDLDAARGDGGESWILERSAGGMGFLESLHERMVVDGRAFLRLVRSALLPGDLQRSDEDLSVLLEHASEPDHPVWCAVDAYREGQSGNDKAHALGVLRRSLADAGIPPVHTTVAAIIGRLARPGTSRETDTIAGMLLGGWRTAEEQLGIELGLRTWQRQGLRLLEGSGRVLPGRSDDVSQRDAISSLLWPRGWRLRSDGLASYTPFERRLPSAPDLVLAHLESAEQRVDITDPDALSKISVQLAQIGSCRVFGATGSGRDLAQIVATAATTPVDIGDIIAFPRLSEYQGVDGGLIAHLDIREVL
jgi:hypothetical protein